jgi:hypothetical protein
MNDTASPLMIAVVTAFATAFTTHLFSYSKERRKAAADFRATFLSSLREIYPQPARFPKGQDMDQYLRQVFPVLQSAVAQFRPYVPQRHQKAFDEAWFRYYCSTGREIDGQIYHDYIFHNYESNPEDKFRCNVDTLLSFANDATDPITSRIISIFAALWPPPSLRA